MASQRQLLPCPSFSHRNVFEPKQMEEYPGSSRTGGIVTSGGKSVASTSFAKTIRTHPQTSWWPFSKTGTATDTNGTGRRYTTSTSWSIVSSTPMSRHVPHLLAPGIQPTMTVTQRRWERRRRHQRLRKQQPTEVSPWPDGTQ